MKRSTTAISTQKPMILVADDDPFHCRLIELQLQTLGYVGCLCPDGARAFERWTEEPFALLLTDLHMPGMDGYELVAAIRKIEGPDSHIPIIALTGSASPAEIDRALAYGIDGYLRKPVSLWGLRATLQTWMPPETAPLPMSTTA